MMSGRQSVLKDIAECGTRVGPNPVASGFFACLSGLRCKGLLTPLVQPLGWWDPGHASCA